jgi:hypothetical protein
LFFFNVPSSAVGPPPAPSRQEASPHAAARKDGRQALSPPAGSGKAGSPSPAAKTTPGDATDGQRRIDTASPGGSSTADPSLQVSADAHREARLAPDEGATAAATASTPPAVPATHLKVSKAAVCSDIEHHMPVDVAGTFPASVERIYVWNQVETDRYPTTIRHIYYFEGRKVSDVTLKIRSPSWRTWSFKSIADDRYRGDWRVDITTPDGTVLRRLFFKVGY